MTTKQDRFRVVDLLLLVFALVMGVNGVRNWGNATTGMERLFCIAGIVAGVAAVVSLLLALRRTLAVRSEEQRPRNR